MTMKFAAFTMLLLVNTFSWADESNLALESMSAKEMKATGIDKLSESERRALEAWVLENYAARSGLNQSVSTLDGAEAPTEPVNKAAESVNQPDRRGLTAVVDSSEIESQISGRFSGWKGRTVFTLANGQIWKQTDPSETAYFVQENPPVRISRGIFGGWYFQVIGRNSKARVRRLK